MSSNIKKANTESEKLFNGILLLNAKIFGVTLGLLTGLLIFIATNWLVLKGGATVGPNLQLLGQYFIGFRVTFWGSFIGFAYGFLLGFLCGALIGWIYNMIAHLRKKL